MIERWQTQDKNSNIDKTAFFGMIYEHDSRSFKFSIGDRLQIKAMAAHVQNIVGEKNEHIQHFAPVSSGKVKRNNQTDQYFGFSRKATINLPLVSNSASEMKCETLPANSVEELSEQLFNSVLKLLEKKEINRSIIERLHKHQFSIKVTDERIIGKFPCVLCKNSHKKMFTAQTKYENDRIYWVLSNYSQHVKSHFKGKQLQCDLNDFGDMVGEDFYDETEPEFKGELLDIGNDHENSTTVDLKVELLPDGEFAKIHGEIYTQISNQLGRMNDSVLSHGEKEHNMQFNITNSQCKLQVVKIPSDGSCLFGALIHQLFGTGIKSDEHRKLTAKLRADVVTHIKLNVESFEHELKGAVLNTFEGKKVRNMKQKCIDFLHKELPDESTWAGVESFRAVCEMENLNILVVNEGGTGYFSPCSFDRNLTQTVLVAFRLKTKTLEANASNINRNHYDSVVRMEQSDVYDLAKSLASIAWKKENAKNETINLIT